jgi:RimJ/RimL family protein N-acetyltransferase
MESPYWPLFGLRISTPRLEIRLPNDDDLGDLASLASQGIHDPATMPFLYPWTDEPSPSLERGLMQWGWRHRAEWSVNRWTFNGAVFVDGGVVGVQSLTAHDFAIERSVKTGSWLGRAYQGRGIGTEMRTAILSFAFDALAAREALSGGFVDNESSLKVSRRLGYEDDGRRSILRRGIPTEMVDLRMDLATWRRIERTHVVISGFDGCKEFFIDPDVVNSDQLSNDSQNS